MKVLLLSPEANGTSIAHRLASEGHSVALWTRDEKFQDVLRGFPRIERVPNFRPKLPWADLIISDMVGLSHLESTILKLGKPNLGFSPFADALELDRVRGMKTLDVLGVSTPPTEFTTVRDAKGKKLGPIGTVIKPSGNLSTSSTLVVRTQAEFDWALASYYKPDDELILQDFIDGVEISTEGWFNGRSWITPFNHTMEEKRLAAGSLGPHTGCMGNVVWALKQPDKLVEHTLLKITPALSAVGYRGPFDINCIVTESTAFALEISPRFGYDALEALMQGLNEPLADVLFETALGIKESIDVLFDWLIAVRIVQAPFPSSNLREAQHYKNSPIELTSEAEKHFFPSSLQRVNGALQVVPSDGVIGKVTAFGRDVREARRRAQRTAENVRGIDLFFRNDIGDRVDRDIAQLRQWGWIR